MPARKTESVNQFVIPVEFVYFEILSLDISGIAEWIKVLDHEFGGIVNVSSIP